MTTREFSMNERASLTEIYLRFSRRSMLAVFFLALTLGILGLAVAFQPNSDFARWIEHLAWMIPIAIAIGAGILQATLRRNRWDPSSAEAKTILNDEWRQANLDRAARWTLGIVLFAQAPLAVAFAFFTDLPARQAVVAMAIASITLGLTSMTGLFLWLDRE